MQSLIKGTFLALLLTIFVISVQANDSSVETAAGGLKLRKEHSVQMAKERLYIEENKVVVEYEFINTSDKIVISEVAFPIPKFDYDVIRGPIDFSDFKAWVEGKQIRLKKEAKAFVGDRDITPDLIKNGITIESFGYYSDRDDSELKKYEVLRLPLNDRRKLVNLGAVEGPQGMSTEGDWHYPPKWWVQLKYHWTQEFPPRKTVKVKHEYKPVVGFRPIDYGDILKIKNDLCIDTSTLDIIKTMSDYSLSIDPSGAGYFHISWVNYILTTANSWKTPINNFELDVMSQKGSIITFCWDEPLDRKKSNYVKAIKSNYVPIKDLKIYFIWIH